MKKIVCLLLAVLTMLGLCACGGASKETAAYDSAPREPAAMAMGMAEEAVEMEMAYANDSQSYSVGTTDSSPSDTVVNRSFDSEKIIYSCNAEIETLTFEVEGNTLRITYEGLSDKTTVFNPTNHCYFNLNGENGANVTNHLLQINAKAYTPVDDLLIPTGELRPVQGTAFDFTVAKPIGKDINAPDDQVQLCGGFDHNFCLEGKGLRMAASATSPKTGIRMECHTDQPGVQLYAGNYLDTPVGKSGPMGKHQGFCLETQTYPDAPNHPSFPSATLEAEEPFRSVTEYRFF